MRRFNRTNHKPLFDILRPDGPGWNWNVSYKVESSGYPSRCHVTATRLGEEGLIGSAACEVGLQDDLREVIEFLAVEAMLAACEPTLWDDCPHREVEFVSGGF